MSGTKIDMLDIQKKLIYSLRKLPLTKLAKGRGKKKEVAGAAKGGEEPEKQDHLKSSSIYSFESYQFICYLFMHLFATI